MNKRKILVFLTLVVAFLLASCNTSAVSTASVSSDKSPLQSDSTGVVSETSVDKVVIYAPATTSSIPVILAAAQMPNVELTLYTNQSQANTLFLRGDVDILVTGLSVGVDLFKNGAPVQMMNSYVSGLSYLVTYGRQISNLADLKGSEIYLPFEGSPLEESTSYLAAKAGLTYKQDLTPVYSPFDASIQLLKEGKATAVVLPEPNVTLLEGQSNIYISVSYFDAWNAATNTSDGYPQVASFVNSDWAATHADKISEFNARLSDAITAVEKDPEAVITKVSSNFKLSPELLLKSLKRTHYHFWAGQELVNVVNHYYQVIGKPLDEKYSAFYFSAAQ